MNEDCVFAEEGDLQYFGQNYVIYVIYVIYITLIYAFEVKTCFSLDVLNTAQTLCNYLQYIL